MAAKVSEEKKLVVKNVRDIVEASSIVIFADYRGLTVGELTKLRKELRAEGAHLNVYKNTLTRIALDELGIKYASQVLEGPSAVVNSKGDPSKTAKIVVKFSKDLEKLAIKGGIFQKAAVDSRSIESLSKLPSREELIAKAVGGIKAPLNRLVLSLSGPLRGLVYSLKAIENQKAK